MKLMNQEQWDMHNNAINDYHYDTFQDDLIWVRNIITTSKHGEDNNIRGSETILKCLVYYNVFRTWPIDQPTDTGEIDKQSCMVYLNKKWLKENNYLNSDDNLEFDQVQDRFILNGIKYQSTGDSDISQAHNNPLLFFLILKREEVNTGENRY